MIYIQREIEASEIKRNDFQIYLNSIHVNAHKKL